MNCFDVIGPVMVGPSSSHTAGAVRLGQIASILLAEKPLLATIGLHGSFARTGSGHGTDKAILAGLLGFAPDDERIRQSRQLAQAAGLNYTFISVQLDRAHPNTAVIDLRGISGRTVNMRGASTGGGRIRVEAIDGLEVSFRGEYMTLIIRHHDAPGVVADVTHQLSRRRINIANMRVFRAQRGGAAVMIIETDPFNATGLCQEIRQTCGVQDVVLAEPLPDQI